MAVRWWGLIRLVPFPIALVLGIGMCGPCVGNCGGHSKAMIELVERCPRAVAVLGTDIRTARFGCSCGETELFGATGRAHWESGISGSKSSGRIEYSATMTDDEWTVTSATLDIGDEQIDVVRCARGKVAERPDPGAQIVAQTPDEAVTTQLGGKVLRSTHPQITDGTTCTGSLARAQGSPTAHVTFACGTLRLYDGLAGFKMDVGDPRSRGDDTIEVEDEAASAVDRTPGLRMQGRTLMLWDGSPAFEITVALTD